MQQIELKLNFLQYTNAPERHIDSKYQDQTQTHLPEPHSQQSHN